MNAIVIVYDGQLLTERAGTVLGLDILRRDGDTDNTRKTRNASGRDQTIPPFWTWFIENPRSCGA